MTQPRLVGGRYELGELIGYGGMAEVHRGHDTRLGREVAIKMLRADLARDPSFLNRFRREAQAAAGLNHPSIVAVYDTGEDFVPDPAASSSEATTVIGATAALPTMLQPYIVMEYVSGRTLRDIVKTEGRLPARRVMEIGADVCGALDFSHRAGIVHRDIKPANVMITAAGAVKVMDFGIARAAGDNAATVTQTANVIGTAQYLSPEQARGEAVDARSDVYSTGCLLYELATGIPPFQGDSPVAVAYQHVRENPVAPSARNPEIPAALDSVIMKALAKNPVNRYQSAGEMRTDLERALANLPVAAEAVMTDEQRTQLIARTPVPPVAIVHGEDEPVGPDPSRRTGLIWLAIILALLVVAGGIAAVVLVTRNGTPSVKKIAVPNIVGSTQDQAQTALKNAGFANSSVGDITNGPCTDGKTVDKGQVCLVDPAPGVMADPATTRVTFRLFTPKTAQVPNVEGQQWNDAANAVHAAGLTPKRKNVDSADPAGQVVDQTPGPYATVPPGSPVTLSVSTGKVKLPDVSTSHPTWQDAQTALNSAGYTNVQWTYQNTTDKTLNGRVASQSLSSGIAYPPGDATAITLTVYRYQPACTTPPPPTSPSPPASSTPPPSTTGTPPPGSTPTDTAVPPAGASVSASPAGFHQATTSASSTGVQNAVDAASNNPPNLPDPSTVPTPTC